MKEITLFSPAKLNLFLRVLRKREDGYHDLASLFQAISLGDTITYSLSQEDAFTVSGLEVPLGKDNLIFKAIYLYREKTGFSSKINVHLEKRIPLEAGLGGGSSNAATTLWAMKCLSNQNLHEDVLRSWGAELGSDVPFFFSSGTAYCTGRGENVTSLEPLEQKEDLWIVKPPMGLSTPLIFKHLNLNECGNYDPQALLERFKKGDPLYHNDLELPAFRVLPGLLDLKERLLSNGHSHVTLTGSGTSFFCFNTTSCSLLEKLFITKETFINRNDTWY